MRPRLLDLRHFDRREWSPLFQARATAGLPAIPNCAMNGRGSRSTRKKRNVREESGASPDCRNDPHPRGAQARVTWTTKSPLVVVNFASNSAGAFAFNAAGFIRSASLRRAQLCRGRFVLRKRGARTHHLLQQGLFHSKFYDTIPGSLKPEANSCFFHANLGAAKATPSDCSRMRCSAPASRGNRIFPPEPSTRCQGSFPSVLRSAHATRRALPGNPAASATAP